MPWTRRRKVATASIAGACGVIAILLLLTAVGSWAPILHWTCQPGARVLDQRTEIPLQFLNAPYGGWVWGNVTTPPGVILRGTNVGIFLGSSFMNGGVVWNGFEANVTAFSTSNQTEWGPGGNSRCTGPFEVELIADGNFSTGIQLAAPGNVSDENMPTVLLPSNPGPVTFSDRFTVANSANISTCGRGPASLPLVTSHNLTLWVSFTSGGLTRVMAIQAPIIDSTFHYWFPANFGSWQVDNLSAPGGPGGGWAFSYSPCS